ncbi:hypothetical protein Ocin01_05666 [Orchesella cincta]|uniref:MADF domain-containing protein n=1 Tax=Orchesella cincta TaxID=48709 RepID=A0A1D2N6V9_ORCCI|nr:hypothetical protein Ocin01_05666 [Orchesella cincta]
MKRKAVEADKPEKKLRWDVPKTSSLICFYKDHPELWNPRVPEYSNDKLRLKAVENWLLENQMEPDKDLVNEVKLKLHGLRTSYGHELKMEATKKIEGNPYVSKWQWYRQLSFLKEAMCFRSRSGSVSSTANGRRITRRRGRRGIHTSLSMSEDIDHDHNHNESYYNNDHDGNDVKIVAIDHLEHGASAHGYHMVEAEYDHHPHSHPHPAHQSHHHSQHPGLVHMAVNLADSHHHIAAGANDSLPPQDPHVPVVTYRSREPAPLAVTATTITRHDSSSNLNSLCLAASASATPEKQPQIMAGAGDEPRGIIPAVCNCKCRSAPQTIGEKLGRLVEETFSNLHPEYHEMARWEIQQILGKYLQKPIP